MAEDLIVVVFDFHMTLIHAHFGGAISTSRENRLAGGGQHIKSLGTDENRRNDMYDFELLTELFRRGPGAGVLLAIATNLGNRWDCFSPEDVKRIREQRAHIEPDCASWISGRRAVYEWLKLLYPSEHAMRDVLPEELVQAISPTANSPEEEYLLALRQLESAVDMTAQEKERMALGAAGKNTHIKNILAFLRGTKNPTSDALIGHLPLSRVVFFDDRPLNVEMAQRFGVTNSLNVIPMFGVSARTWPDFVSKSPLLAEVHQRLWPTKEPHELFDLLHPRPVGFTSREGSPSTSPMGSPRVALPVVSAIVGFTLFTNEAMSDDACAVCNVPSKNVCGACKRVAYCSVGCARAHWNHSHSMLCRGLRVGPKKRIDDMKDGDEEKEEEEEEKEEAAAATTTNQPQALTFVLFQLVNLNIGDDGYVTSDEDDPLWQTRYYRDVLTGRFDAALDRADGVVRVTDKKGEWPMNRLDIDNLERMPMHVWKQSDTMEYRGMATAHRDSFCLLRLDGLNDKRAGIALVLSDLGKPAETRADGSRVYHVRGFTVVMRTRERRQYVVVDELAYDPLWRQKRDDFENV
jgi:hypothetical protein